MIYLNHKFFVIFLTSILTIVNSIDSVELLYDECLKEITTNYTKKDVDTVKKVCYHSTLGVWNPFIAFDGPIDLSSVDIKSSSESSSSSSLSSSSSESSSSPPSLIHFCTYDFAFGKTEDRSQWMSSKYLQQYHFTTARSIKINDFEILFPPCGLDWESYKSYDGSGEKKYCSVITEAKFNNQTQFNEFISQFIRRSIYYEESGKELRKTNRGLFMIAIQFLIELLNLNQI